MSRRWLWGGLLLAAALGLVAVRWFHGDAPALSADQVLGSEPPSGLALDAAAVRGKRLYQRGESVDGGEVTAVLAAQGVEIPATAMPCGSCHGRDGRGRAEGGVVPADLRWQRLRAPAVRSDGKPRSAYDERSFVRAVTLGIDPDGTPLHPVMPRYRLRHGDAQDLLAYVQQLDRDLDPGVTTDRLRLATLVPAGEADGQADATGAAIAALLAARLFEVNHDGGLFGRQLELAVLTLPAGTEPAAVLDRAMEETPFFALLAPAMGAEVVAIGAWAARQEIPVLTPFTEARAALPAGERQLFFLYSGALEQLRALVEHAALSSGPAAGLGTVLVHPSAGQDRGRLRAAVDQARRSALDVSTWELPDPHTSEWPPEAGRLIVCGPATFAAAVVEAAGERGWSGEILVAGDDAGALLAGTAPGGVQTAEAHPASRPTVLIALPNWPARDVTRRGAARWQTLADEHALTSNDLPLQYAALASADLLVAALHRAGRNLSRERLIEALETLPPVQTGLTPPLSFAPHRHTAAHGAYLATLDPATGRLTPFGEWVVPR
jgi:ABC-type branched-subunit amino acid transport system substrate-binding protein/cytochrome c553